MLECRAELALQQLEGSMKGMKKEAGQQLRELQVDRCEKMRAMQEAQDAAVLRESKLQVPGCQLLF